jgi:hypothetical protein
MFTVFIVSLTFIFSVMTLSQFNSYSNVNIGINTPTSFNPTGNYTLEDTNSFTIIDFMKLQKNEDLLTFSVFILLFWIIYIFISGVMIYKILLPSA